MILAGLGLSQKATKDELDSLLAAAGHRPDHLVLLRNKAEFSAVADFAASQALPVITLDEDEIVGEQVLTFSQRIRDRFQTGSVAEALALVAARRFGPARLLGPRQISPGGHATLALAQTQLAETTT